MSTIIAETAKVLILVLVDFTLRRAIIKYCPEKLDRLNPCFSGLYTPTQIPLIIRGLWLGVLILVLVDFTLRHIALSCWTRLGLVLILVLVDFTLRRGNGKRACLRNNGVLILVLVDFTLRQYLLFTHWLCFTFVLILVLVDFTLRPWNRAIKQGNRKSLNPCFSGLYTPTHEKIRRIDNHSAVLILVLVDFTLRQLSNIDKELKKLLVLILVLVDFTLRPGSIATISAVLFMS